MERLDPDDVVVDIESLAALRDLPVTTQGMLRAWVVATVGEDSWERATRLVIRQGGRITLRRYAVDDDGYVIDAAGTAQQEEVEFRSAAPFPIHIIGPVR